MVSATAAPAALAQGAETEPVRVAGPVEIDNPRDAMDWAVNGAQVLATLAALAALLFLARQVAGARSDADSQRALAFQERYTSREFSRIISPLLAFFAVDDAADCVDKIRAEMTSPHAEAQILPRTPRDPSAPQACVNDIQHVMAFFEDLGTAHEKKLLNRDVVLLSFGNTIVQMFMVAWWYVCWERGGRPGDEMKMYLEFERLALWLMKKEEQFASFEPNPHVRLLVLPRDGRHAGWGTWEVCRDLSKALSEYLNGGGVTDIAAVRTRVGQIIETLLPKAGDDLFDTVIAIPPRVDVEAKVWAKQRDEAALILDQLGGLDARQARMLVDQLPAGHVATT